MSESTAKTTADPSLEAGFRELVALHERAWNAHDPKLLMTLFSEEVDFVNVVGTHHRTRESLEREFFHLHTTFMRNSRIRMTAHDAREIAPGAGVAHVHWQMTGVEKVPGWNVPDERHGVLTYVLVKREGRWQVTAAQNTDVVEIAMPQ